MFVAIVLLVVAIGVEVVASAFLPRANGFTHLGWSTFVLVGYGISIWLLAVVIRTIPISITYAVWSGVGTAMVAVVAYFYLGESMNAIKLASLALIVAGVVGLNIAGAH